MSLPTLILIPGAYTPHTIYNDFLPLLRAHNIEAYALPLQTVGRRPLPAPHMYDDAAFIATEVRKLVDLGKRVVLLGHSYGGVPISQCTEGLSVKERAAEGKKGGVARLVYLTALVPRPGETASGEEPGDLAGAGYLSHYLSFDPELALRFTLSDIPREKALSLGNISQEMSAVSQVDALTWAGYKDVPSTYIVTKQDQALSVDRQQVAIEVLKEFAPDEGGPEILEIDSGHAPNLSKPEELAKMLKDIVERAK
ncbi:hypothetical protein N0V93_008626 [Gnomoniopsis smithogilvyi]|uniref:AB hydrolase-1 domain-containing protein n=1 Tax=Gnomoniopsis smithogilvyi TaxID=1191159 RepID=A0A9W9CU31_9PEZI|nr:hypothetical protein N0V93_008626 [Gnomoniopsis smithogilvyi]